MNDDALMEIAARVDPLPADAYRGLAGTAWGRDTLDSILKARPRGTRRGVRALAALAVAASVAGLVVLAQPAERRSVPERRWSAALVTRAQQSPRLLIAAPGWRIDRANDYGEDGGETTFGNGRLWMDVNWYPGRLYDMYVTDRRRGAERVAELTVDGHHAVLFRHDGNAPIGVTFYALWFDGSYAVELRTDVIAEESDFREVARSVESVDVDTWLAAMPESVVTPEERQRAIERIVADMDVPPNVDLQELAGRQVVTQSLDFEVATAVVCGWIEWWIEADEAGDEAGRREAAEALAGAHDWDAVAGNSIQAGYVAGVAEEMQSAGAAGGSGSVGARFRRDVGCD
jgi:hypothetical protein